MTRLGAEILKQGSLFFTTMFFELVNRQPFEISPHHVVICGKLDQILNNSHPTNRLILNIPPRHSKTELAVVSFTAMGFAINPNAEVMHLSAAEALAVRNVTNIRKIMELPDYMALYPETILSNKAKSSIQTTLNGVLYAAPFLGQVTGFGCGKLQSDCFAGAMLIDDPMKAQDQFSDTIKNKLFSLWNGTFKSRLNDVRTPVIVTAQRLAEDDFCGRLIDSEGTIENGGVWDVVKFPAILDFGKPTERALWEERNPLASLKDYAEHSPYDFETQYMQKPTSIEGLLFQKFRTYDIIPFHEDNMRRNYTDTADTGADYLCSICYVETPSGCYITDILYTKKPMEFTEEATADMLVANNTQQCYIESNNGGRGFARNVEKNLRLRGKIDCSIEPFAQRNNKISRINTASASVQNYIYYPIGWEQKWRDFARDVKSYRKEGKNAHDDAPDALSGIIEFADPNARVDFRKLAKIEKQLFDLSI